MILTLNSVNTTFFLLTSAIILGGGRTDQQTTQLSTELSSQLLRNLQLMVNLKAGMPNPRDSLVHEGKPLKSATKRKDGKNPAL